jgi:Fusaric acid resistance protein-like
MRCRRASSFSTTCRVACRSRSASSRRRPPGSPRRDGRVVRRRHSGCLSGCRSCSARSSPRPVARRRRTVLARRRRRFRRPAWRSRRADAPDTRLAGVGFSYDDIAKGAGLALIMVAGSVYACLVSMLWPEADVLPPPPPPQARPSLDYGARLGLAGATAAAIGFGLDLDHVGWACAAALLVMRPSAEMQRLRSIGRLLSVIAGAAAGVLRVTVVDLCDHARSTPQTPFSRPPRTRHEAHRGRDDESMSRNRSTGSLSPWRHR